MTEPLNQLSATEAARRIAARTLRIEDLVRACLERIDAREPTVQAWEHVDSAGALKRAREFDRGPSGGLLHGLPVGAKDIFDTRDMPTRYGSPIYANHQPAVDAASVALTRAAGGIVLGKTVTTEFATFKANKTRNPHNPAHTPGGSSSGSAAAVADGMVPLAFGTQTAGSIIRPASFCGVVGYKPTHGLLPRAGVKPTSDVLDTVGVFARSVADVALMSAALSRNRALLIDESAAPSIRLGICRTQQWSHAEPETIAMFERLPARLAASSIKVADVSLPASFDGLLDAQQTIMAYDCAQELYSEYADHRAKLSAILLERIDKGLALPFEQYDAAIRLADRCRAQLDSVFADANVDVLLVPSSPGEAPHGLHSTGDSVMNRVWTLLHAPCITLPVATGPRGLPLGVQIVGRIGADMQALTCAHQLHRVLRER